METTKKINTYHSDIFREIVETLYRNGFKPGDTIPTVAWNLAYKCVRLKHEIETELWMRKHVSIPRA